MSKVDINEKIRRNKYWNFLRDVQADFIELTWKTEYGTQADFEYFLTSNYGITPIMNEGQYTGSFKVVDDRKFFLTKIKYDI